MLFLEVDEACLNILGVVYFIRELLKIAYIIVPVGTIIMITIDFVKGVIAFGDTNSSIFSYISKRLINTMLIFLIPTLVFTLIDILDFTSNNSEMCWNYIDEVSVEEVRNIFKTKQEEIEWDTQVYINEIAQKLSITDPHRARTIVELSSNTNNEEDGGTVVGQKYNLTSKDLTALAYVAKCEQGSAKGAAAEASLMANLFELNPKVDGCKDGHCKDLKTFVRDSNWFAHSKSRIDNPGNGKECTGKASDSIKAAVADVLVNGNRTLPIYVVEHDCWDCDSDNHCKDGKKGDICFLTINGKKQSSMSAIKNRGNYKKDQTVITNVMGQIYTFYTFPTPHADPFGYTKEAKKKYDKLNK